MRTINLGVEHEIQVPRVVETRAVVRDRQFVDALDMPGVLDGDCGVVSERLQESHVALAEPLRARYN